MVCPDLSEHHSKHQCTQGGVCLPYECNSGVSEVRAIHMQDADSYKMFGSEGQGINNESQKVVL